MIHLLQKIGLTVPMLLLVTTTLAVIPASAEHDANSLSSETGSLSTSLSNQVKNTATTQATHTETKTEVNSSVGSTANDEDSQTTSDLQRSSITDLKKRGEAEVEQKKAAHKSDATDKNRHASCEAHKQGLEQKFMSIYTNANRYQTKIDEAFNKAQQYATDNKLTGTTGYANAVSAAAKAQAASQKSVSYLQTIKPSLDCNNTSVAVDVATYKAATSDARANLKSYRQAVRTVIKTLLDSKSDEANKVKTTENL